MKHFFTLSIPPLILLNIFLSIQLWKSLSATSLLDLFHSSEIAHLTFSEEPHAKLRINNESSIPPFKPEHETYLPISFSALTDNTISFGNQTQKVSVSKIRPGDFINISIGDQTYRIDIFPKEMPTYRLIQKKKSNGYLFFTPFEGSCKKPSYAYISKANGDLVYFRRNRQDKKCLSDFKKTVLPDGRVRYSVMEQEKNMPPLEYWSGALLIMDERLNPLKRIRLLPTTNHPVLGIENHDSLILDDDHFIVASYYQTEAFIPHQDQPARIVALLLQEIKGNQVIFEWDSRQHPELYKTCLNQCNYKAFYYQDYIHFNSVIIDPKDNNFILSFGGQSSIVKIDRKSGKIIWHLGGLADDFNISDKYRFASQHAISILPDGRLMIFDNRSPGLISSTKGLHVPKLATTSRILIFDLDEPNRKIKSVQEISLPHYANTMGSVYLSDDNRFIVGYGSSKKIAGQEISSDGSVFLELYLNGGKSSYRVRKYNRLD